MQQTKILNLTQHPATADQVAAGVRDFDGEALETLKSLLTFNDLPTSDEGVERAEKIAKLAKEFGYRAAMIGGAPYLMPALERALCEMGIRPLYAFSRRESVEKTLPGGEVVKTQVFKHLGFVEATTCDKAG